MFFNEFLSVGVTVRAKAFAHFDSHLLLNEKFDFAAIQFATGIVYINLSFSNFIRQEDIFFERGPHLGDALVQTAPGLDSGFFCLLFVGF